MLGLGIKASAISSLSRFAKVIEKKTAGYNTEDLLAHYVSSVSDHAPAIKLDTVSKNALEFTKQMKLSWGSFKFCENSREANLYGAVYAHSIFRMVNAEDPESSSETQALIHKILESQSSDSGFFEDDKLASRGFSIWDWWGRRHISLLIYPCLAASGCVVRYPLNWLAAYNTPEKVINWWNSGDWRAGNDFDNQIMNVGCSLQYARDFLGCKNLISSILCLQELILKKISRQTGLVHPNDLSNCSSPSNLSRAVQFSYHLYPILTYDKIELPYVDAIFASVVATQNKLGGFGVQLNSSACEDIDSIELLYRICQQVPSYFDVVRNVATRALYWVLTNQNADGGFVFRRFAPLFYGHSETSSGFNKSNLFATQFRLLSLHYLSLLLQMPSPVSIANAPGYEF